MPGAGYSQGRVRISTGSGVVKALWELLVAPSAFAFKPYEGVYLNASDSQCIVRYHDRVSGRMVVEDIQNFPGGGVGPDGFSPVNPGEGVFGPSASVVQAGTASANNSLNVILVTGAGWTVNEHSDAGRWVGIRLDNLSGVEWRQIVENTSDTLTLYPNLQVSTGFLAAGKFEIRESQSTTLAGYMAGTPQDWVAAGVAAGDKFYAEGQELVGTVTGTPTARQFTMTPNWGGVTDLNAGYSISMSRTARLGLNRSWLRVANRAAQLREMADQLDAAYGALADERVEYPIAPYLAATMAVTKGFFSVVNGMVHVHIENLRKGGGPVAINDTIFTLPAGARPGETLLYPAFNASAFSWRNIEVLASGVCRSVHLHDFITFDIFFKKG